MRVVNLVAKVRADECTGCAICAHVCPTLAITMEKRDRLLPVIDETHCPGCWNCEQRCPERCIDMVPVEPYTIGLDAGKYNREEIEALCARAKINPEQIVCFCTGTRADELAAAVLEGAQNPGDLSRLTGTLTGCGVECCQPMMRMLRAAGRDFGKPPGKGYQWYSDCITAWEIPQAVREQHPRFRFEEDLALLNQTLRASREGV
ncbi:MAG: 4Fe-4S binding protein [Candidatus Tectomicrobia bacterium]|nr:4Fe-4S binding protein [Candidatus Tectomicrobia bacterium]